MTVKLLEGMFIAGALRRDRLDGSVGPKLEEVEAGQHIKWKNNAYHSPFYERY
jgi:hypothetical protein